MNYLVTSIVSYVFHNSKSGKTAHTVTGKKHLLIASHKYPHLQTLSWILSSHCMGQTGSRVALSISVVRRKRSCNTWDPILFYHVNVLFNHCEFVDMKASKMSALSKPKICFSSVSLYDTSDDGSQVVKGQTLKDWQEPLTSYYKLIITDSLTASQLRINLTILFVATESIMM